VKKPKIFTLIVALLLTAIVAAQADVIVTFHDGKEVRTASVTYDGHTIKLADGTTCARGALKRIALIHEQPRETGAAVETPEDVAELLETAREAVKRFPNAKSILLVDYAYEEKRANGTLLYRYRTTVKILHPDLLTMATQGLYFEEERTKPRIVQARSIDPDGTVHNYDPAAVKISEPSRDAVSYGRGKRMMYQIPQVKVGSIVDFTHEYEIFNPYDPEMFFPWWNFAGTEPFVHTKLEIVMPRGQELHYAARNIPEESRKPLIIPGQQTTTYVWEMRNQPGVIEEPYMPPVSDIVPHLECSPFADWSHIKKWASERLERRMKATKELEELVAAQTKGIEETHGKIAALYHYVQRNIQYNSIKGSIASGMCGHPASDTFEKKRGDCIDVAVLLSAFLRIAGIQEACPVWVSTNDSSTIPTEIPTLGGNHAIVEIHLDDRIFYLDPTATNFRYPAFRPDDHGVYAINPILAMTNFITVPDASENGVSTEYAVNLSPDGHASIKFLQLRTGGWEAGLRGYFIRSNKEEIEKALRSMVNSYAPGGKLGPHEIKNAKDLTKQLEWHMNFTLPNYATKAGDLLILRIPGLSYSFPEVALEKRKYDIDYKSSEQIRHKVTLNVPEGYRVKYLPPDIELNSEYATYSATCKQEGDTITFEDCYRQLTRYVPVKDYASHRAQLQKIARYSKEHIFFEKAE
jgi:transglutaminase-like putative cysteine protease